ncbi:transcriptional regulator (AraC/XylS family) (partial) [Oceanobacillus iheyensis HTE831]|uniref:Transcriptional regulator (AraC/XylS family) (Partial) n=1 Tax=Oceanobacillus iheyensis (strain DSM 14371 / CIP 107618 / JCM 11309 / KCTC 3954 / HTE831) TaxID=221109 RepID=Q8ERR4_OCEIH|nr:GyrI-like domain-containing protein [Oceanobacillus iheyensis]BAC13193.1 transcriptional regulator (AraC/XylS family) (partial) [Oceanobacillus iheyensis HTE831]
MKFKEFIKDSFVLVGFSAAGKWDEDIVYPIPRLWEKSRKFISERDADKIVGVCLPPRSNHYFYTCGMEMNSVDFHKIDEGMTIHTFPEQKYVVFKHIGSSKTIPSTYEKIWSVFDKEGYSIKEGMPEIEVVSTDMFGKEETKEYEMEVSIPVK